MNNEEFIEAHRWEQLTGSSLPTLRTFKFIFYYDQDISTDRFNQFWTDFWDEHQWLNEYVTGDRLSFIYTIPYSSTTFALLQGYKRYCHQIWEHVSTLTNVTDLMLYEATSTKSSKYDFSNVVSSTLVINRQSLKLEYLSYLKENVNLFSLRHSNIIGVDEMSSAFILGKILEEAPQLRSITIHWQTLKSLLNDAELCKDLNRMIKRLNIHGCHHGCLDNSPYQQAQFRETFRNIEHLICEIEHTEEVIPFLNNFRKLSTLDIKWPSLDDPKASLIRLANELLGHNLIHNIDIQRCASRNFNCDQNDFDSNDVSSLYLGRNYWTVNIHMWLGQSDAPVIES